MNDLNSALLEGKMSGVLVDSDKEYIISINNKYERLDKDPEFTFFTVVSSGPLANECKKYFKQGRGVRVVGRMKRYGDEIAIYAEHIEFKPEFKEFI